jgi:RNA polymerase sigma-70 factor (ECF subfamily)
MSSASPSSGSAQPAAREVRVRVKEEHRALLSELYRASGAEQYGLSCEQFALALTAVADKYLADSGLGASEFYRSLRVEELALARGCAAGHEPAWDVFLNRYRAKLYDAGRAIARDDAVGRELADGLYADLFGTNVRDGRRISKLDYYMGRGSLEGWLRTVLAQEYVNRYRSQQRLVSLDEQEEEGHQFVAPDSAAGPVAGGTGHDPSVDAAVDRALADASPEERFMLAAYFLDGRTLAEIGRMLGVHESSVSRRLEKVCARLRKQIRQNLERAGMSRRQAEEALDIDVRDLAVNVSARLRPPPAENSAGQ